MLESLLSTFSSSKKTRLRHVLYLGSLMERQAKAFYNGFAEKAQDAEVKELCAKLADEESQHFQLISDILAHWKRLPISKGDLAAMDANGRLREIFLHPPNSSASKREIIEYAMNEEKKMVDFYQTFDEEFSDIWKKARLWEMVEEEVRHVTKLQDMLSKLSSQFVAK